MINNHFYERKGFKNYDFDGNYDLWSVYGKGYRQ